MSPTRLLPTLLLPALLTGCARNRMSGQWDITLWEIEGGGALDVTDDAGWLHFSNDVGWELVSLLRYEWDGEVLVPIETPQVVSSGFTKLDRKVDEEVTIQGVRWVITDTGPDSLVLETDELPAGGHSVWTVQREL